MCSEHRSPQMDPEHSSDIEINLPARRQDDPAAISYYGMPSVKQSHYHWKTALSFLAEALGGAPQIIATLIRFFGNRKDHNLVRAGRYLALASSLLSPVLLISELHTPRRWFYMLRIFRRTSSMCIGNMSLTTFGIFSGMTAIGQMLEDYGYTTTGRRISTAFSLPAAAAGGMICLYPGTELEETCTPLWTASHPLLSPLIASTGFSCGAAALAIAAQHMHVSDQGHKQLNNLASMTLGVQLAIALLTEGAWRNNPSGRSYQASVHALAYRFGIGIGILFPLVLRFNRMWTGKRLPNREVAASTATIAGGFLLYNAVLEAGNQSAANPAEYLEHQQKTELFRGDESTPVQPGRRWRRIGFSLLAGAGIAFMFLKRRSRR